MGMQYDHVVIYGWKVSEDDFEMFSDDILPYVEGRSDRECQMYYGEEINQTGYAVFGKCLAFADKWEPFEGIDLDVSDVDRTKMKNEYIDAFGKQPETEYKLIAHSVYR